MYNYLLFILMAICSVVNSAVITKRYQLEAGTKFRASAVYALICGVISAAVAAVVLLVKHQPLQATRFSLVCAAAMVLVSLMEMYYTLKALSMDKIAVVRTITTVGAMVLSCVWGAVILREHITPLRLCGIGVIIAAVLLLSLARETRVKLSHVLLSLLPAVFSAAGSIISKQHQVEQVYAHVDTLSFSVWVGLIRAGVFALIVPLMVRRSADGLGQSKRSMLFAALSSFISGITYIVSLHLAKILPISVTTPLFTSLSLILSAVFGRIIYRERLNARTAAAVLMALAGALMMMR